MKVKTIQTNLAPKALGPYSQGIKADAFYYFSGQLGIDPKSNSLKEGFTEQVDQIMSNIDNLLQSQGLERKNVIKTTVFLTDLSNFGEINKAYNSFFAPPYPARSCVEIAALPLGAFVEIEVVAVAL